MPLTINQARADEFPALEQMLELYQYDLSDIWHQDLSEDGRYGFDLTRHKRAESSHAYLAKMDGQYVGFALTALAIVTRTDGTWMEQFFILKRYRRAGAGRALAKYVFAAHPGGWEIGQIPGNTAAYHFWRSVIGEVTQGKFAEVQVTQGWWRGVVQQFNMPDSSL